jgi:hypothetical protein
MMTYTSIDRVASIFSLSEFWAYFRMILDVLGLNLVDESQKCPTEWPKSDQKDFFVYQRQTELVVGGSRDDAMFAVFFFFFFFAFTMTWRGWR